MSEKGIKYKLPSGNVIRILPKYISQNRLAFLIPAYELIDDIEGFKEDDNPVLMIMDL